MAKQSSSSGQRNDARASGKAGKKNPGRKNHGSKSSRLDEGTLVLMGKGLFVKYERMNNEGLRQMANKRNKKDSKDS